MKRSNRRYSGKYAQHKRGAGLGVMLLCVLLALAAAAALLWTLNVFTLELKVAGDREMTLEYGDDYTELGAEAWFSGTILERTPVSVSVTVSGQVDPYRLGEQTVSYEAAYAYQWLFGTLEFTASGQRNVLVRDTQAPQITLTTLENAFTIPGEDYAEEGFFALDNVDGDLTGHVEWQLDDGKMIYRVTDSSGNTAEAVRTIRYHDPIPPVLELVGGESLVVTRGQTFQDPGCVATDNCDGDITDWVTVSGQVDAEKLGSYTLQYKVTDTYGNEAVVERTVTVRMMPAAVQAIAGLPNYDPANPPEANGKVIYLTFDDGPSEHTERLLDILDAYGVKVTFFVVNSSKTDLLTRMAAAGHTVAIHSSTHNYARIYQDEEAYFRDFNAIKSTIEAKTGITPTMLRFPGGTSNTVSRNYNKGIMGRLSRQLKEMGYRIFDWNVDSGDAMNAFTVKAVYDNVTQGIQGRDTTVVLQHDTNSASVDATEAIIIWGLANGYTFLPLTQDSPPCQHGVAN